MTRGKKRKYRSKVVGEIGLKKKGNLRESPREQKKQNFKKKRKECSLNHLKDVKDKLKQIEQIRRIYVNQKIFVMTFSF